MIYSSPGPINKLFIDTSLAHNNEARHSSQSHERSRTHRPNTIAFRTPLDILSSLTALFSTSCVKFQKSFYPFAYSIELVDLCKRNIFKSVCIINIIKFLMSPPYYKRHFHWVRKSQEDGLDPMFNPINNEINRNVATHVVTLNLTSWYPCIYVRSSSTQHEILSICLWFDSLCLHSSIQHEIMSTVNVLLYSHSTI